jgi:hypothetical protein
MKLKFYINSESKKVYTLKEEFENKKTIDAHYKFIKIRDAPPSNNLKNIKNTKSIF